MTGRSDQKIAYLGYVTPNDLVLVMVPATNQTDPGGDLSLRGGQVAILRNGDTAPLMATQFTDENSPSGIRMHGTRWQRLTTVAGVFEWRLVEGITYTPFELSPYSWQASPLAQRYRTELSQPLNPAHFDITWPGTSVRLASKPRKLVMAGVNRHALREFICVTAVGGDMTSAELYIGPVEAGLARRRELICAIPTENGGFTLLQNPPYKTGEDRYKGLPSLLKYMPTGGKGGRPKAEYGAMVDLLDPSAVTRINQRDGEVHFAV